MASRREINGSKILIYGTRTDPAGQFLALALTTTGEMFMRAAPGQWQRAAGPDDGCSAVFGDRLIDAVAHVWRTAGFRVKAVSAL